MTESRLMGLVKAMHTKFELANTTGPTHLTPEEKVFRLRAMQEELTEYLDSSELVDEYDALLDLLVFTVGTLERHGFPLLAGFQAVMEANLKKELAGSAEASKRGFSRDLVKPAGWTGPEAKLAEILRRAADKHFTTVAANANDNTDPANTTLKFDGGKAPLDLIPVEPLYRVAEVFGFGAQKYKRENWRAGNPPEWGRIYASIQRHLTSFWAGEDIDPESGLSHLAHAATQVLMMLYYFQFHQDRDNRFKRGAL